MGKDAFLAGVEGLMEDRNTAFVLGAPTVRAQPGAQGRPYVT